MPAAPFSMPPELRPENRRRSAGIRPVALPAGPLRPERSESFYEDLDLPPPPVVVQGPPAAASGPAA